jgi:hypothetical protein
LVKLDRILHSERSDTHLSGGDRIRTQVNPGDPATKQASDERQRPARATTEIEEAALARKRQLRNVLFEFLG